MGEEIKDEDELRARYNYTVRICNLSLLSSIIGLDS